MLVRHVLDRGGSISPLIIPPEASGGTGLLNPAPLVWNDKLILNLRVCNYILYHAEAAKQFNNRWGPLTYLHPEDDHTLRTRNFLCSVNEDLSIDRYTEVDMSKFWSTPRWTFIGLEDARLVDWGGSLYMCGVRRDTTTNGQGRMELSRVELNEDDWSAVEVDRFRIPAPGQDDSYCEKNWMPILDKPFHFVKWTCPTEVVKADPVTRTCETVAMQHGYMHQTDLRGGSQVMRWGNYYVAVTHEVNLWFNYLKQKDGRYSHRMVVWDQDFNIVGVSPDRWSFLGGDIEFCSGGTIWRGDMLLTFGFQDNSAHLLRVPGDVVDEMISEAIEYVNRF